MPALKGENVSLSFAFTSNAVKKWFDWAIPNSNHNLAQTPNLFAIAIHCSFLKSVFDI